jgi:hypothetical protein
MARRQEMAGNPRNAERHVNHKNPVPTPRDFCLDTIPGKARGRERMFVDGRQQPHLVPNIIELDNYGIISVEHRT